MNRPRFLLLAVLALVLVPVAIGASPPGQWGGTADVSKQADVTSVVAESDEYASMYVPQLVGKTFAQIGALGFDSLEESRIGAGAPRYSLLFDDGSYLFPSALYCQETLPDDTVHSDFMSATNCVVYGYTAGTGFVAKTWSEWADIFGEAEVTWPGLVIDEAGEYQLTHIVARPG
jgi:hypothetical protein